MASAEKQISFKVDSDLADRLGKMANKLDENMSKVIRGCLLLAMPVFETNPMLLNVVDTINSYRFNQSNKETKKV